MDNLAVFNDFFGLEWKLLTEKPQLRQNEMLAVLVLAEEVVCQKEVGGEMRHVEVSVLRQQAPHGLRTLVL